jgi:3-hydroxybutyryl-CoA dehydrogenase
MQRSELGAIAVIGAGLMGHGIAQDFAAHGYDVHLYARSQARLDEALRNIESGLDRVQRLGQLTAEQAAATRARIRTGTSLETLVGDAGLVIEAVSEDLTVKQQIFASLDRACPSHAILASTTSALLPSALGRATQRPDRVLVAHYFNPPALVPLVELVRGPETSDETVATVRDVLLRIGKRPAVVQTEVPGFIGNRLQAALVREALSLVDRGVATPEDIDTVVKFSFGPRLSVAGVFEVGDLAGLDLYLSVGKLLFPELESSPEVPRVLREKVEQGQLGANTGQGFYTWTTESAAALRDRIGQVLVEVAARQ